jgi:regulator of RNase E activity RraA
MTATWDSDEELYQLARRELFTALVGDVDGVCIVPQAAEKPVFAAALEKARGEKRVKQAIQAGISTVKVWRKYGIM